MATESSAPINEVSIVIPHDPNRKYSGLLERCVSAVEAEGYVDVHVVAENNLSRARNIGAAQSSGDIIVYIDDDAKPRPGAIHELVSVFSDPQVGVAGGVNVNFPDLDPREKIGAALFASPLAMWKSVARYTPRGDVREADETELVGCFMAVRKTVWHAAGGFPEDVIPCEESHLINMAKKLGWKVVYDPFAVVYHRRPRVWAEYAKTVFRYGYGRGRWIRKPRSRASLGMVWKPSRFWMYCALGLGVHYVCYLSGLVAGLIGPDLVIVEDHET